MGVFSKKGNDGKLRWYIDFYVDGVIVSVVRNVVGVVVSYVHLPRRLYLSQTQLKLLLSQASFHRSAGLTKCVLVSF